MHKFSKNVELTSKFWVPEWEYEQCSIPRTLEYGATTQNLVARATGQPVFVHLFLSSSLHTHARTHISHTFATGRHVLLNKAAVQCGLVQTVVNVNTLLSSKHILKGFIDLQVPQFPLSVVMKAVCQFVSQAHFLLSVSMGIKVL
jgi:hypothetical protein